MVLSGVLRWVFGWVRVEAEGGYPEKLLNHITADGLSVWGVRQRQESLRFCCFARDYRALRPAARRACMRMRARRKSGLPFWVFRYRHRRGLLAGLAVYAAVLLLLSPRIWVIDVVGNTDTTDEDILAVAEKMGVQLGKPMAALQIKNLEIDGLRQLPSLSWITVNPSGCVARVEVTERMPTPQVLDLSQPSDIVALRDGRILRMEVHSGYRMALDGEAVTAGSLLITGRLQTEQGERLYRSYGEVWAETRRQITVSVPLLYDRVVPDGYVALRPTLTFLRWQIPLYAGGLPVGEYRQKRVEHFLKAKGLILPLGVTNEYAVRTRRVPTARTTAQAAQLAAAKLAAQERALFTPDGYEELERQVRVQDGNYVLRVTYKCVENIALEVPISEKTPAD